jgi:DNA-binding NarL/FixJ family response regulator
VIRVVVVDDHPALRAGLRTVLESEPGLVYAGETSDEEGLWPLLARAKPDLVLLDYHLPKGDGLQLCYRIKQDAIAPRVIVYTAYASRALALPAALARADALVDKGLPARQLFEVIRQVNRGEHLLAAFSRATLADAHERVAPDDRPLVSMLLDGATEAEAAAALRTETTDIHHRVQRLLARLRIDVPSAVAG